VANIYEKLGQEGGVRKAVDAFYLAVTADSQLAGYFAGIDMAKLRRHTTALLCTVTGGPSTYAGCDLGQAHAHLGITGDHFTRVMHHVARALDATNLDSASIDAVVGVLAAHRPDIVTAEAGAGEPHHGFHR
jgi:hemoglobin